MRNIVWLAGMAMCSQLVGCGQSTGVPADAGEASPANYHIVTVTRPASAEKFLVSERSTYDLCAAEARLQNLPVQPFPALPQGYFFERKTYVSDGKTWMTRDEQYGLDTAFLVPDKGCRTSFAIASLTQLRRDGTMRTIDVSYDGERQENAEQVDAPHAPSAEDAAVFTVSRTVAGTRVRCLPPGSAALAPRRAAELCVADGGGALPADAEGQPIIVHMKTRNAQDTTDLVMEPVIVRIGGHIDKKAFGDAAAF